MKSNLIAASLITTLTVISAPVTAGTSAVSFLHAITGQTEPTVQNVKDENPGEHLATHYYIRSIAGTVDRVTPAVASSKVSVAESLQLYTSQFDNKHLSK